MSFINIGGAPALLRGNSGPSTAPGTPRTPRGPGPAAGLGTPEPGTPGTPAGPPRTPRPTKRCTECTRNALTRRDKSNLSKVIFLEINVISSLFWVGLPISNTFPNCHIFFRWRQSAPSAARLFASRKKYFF